MAALADHVKSIHPFRFQSLPVIWFTLAALSASIGGLATPAPSHIEILSVLVAQLKSPFPLHSSLPSLFSEYQ